MTTFAKNAFNAVSYSAIRPTYPRALFDYVFRYHEKGGNVAWNRAVDLGCGTGQATVELTPFREVIGLDPSQSMIEKAREKSSSASISNNITFLEHKAEDLSFLESQSVDLVVAAQAAHWFNYEQLFTQLARVLRQNGSVAFWGYSQFRISGHPYLTPLIHEYSKGIDPDNSLGTYWEEPGRTILDNHFIDVPKAPEKYFKAHEHVFWTGDYHPFPSARPIILQKRVSWDGLQAYLRTFSSLYTYQESHPEDSKLQTGLPLRPASGTGDIVERFWWSLKERVAEEQPDSEEEDLVIDWPMAMLLFKRK